MKPSPLVFSLTLYLILYEGKLPQHFSGTQQCLSWRLIKLGHCRSILGLATNQKKFNYTFQQCKKCHLRDTFWRKRIFPFEFACLLPPFLPPPTPYSIEIVFFYGGGGEGHFPHSYMLTIKKEHIFNHFK